MRNQSHFLLLICSIYFFIGCKKTLNEKIAEKPPQEKQPLLPVSDNKAIVLVAKLKNEPFSIQNMRNALTNILARQSGSNLRIEDGTQPTHYYYKITPQSVDDVIRLDTLGYEIWDVPLDQEIENEGDYYQDPSLPEDQITYLYTALPVGVSLPSGIQAQVLQELFLF